MWLIIVVLVLMFVVSCLLIPVMVLWVLRMLVLSRVGCGGCVDAAMYGSVLVVV